MDMSILDSGGYHNTSPLHIKPICLACSQKFGIHTQTTFEMNIIIKGSARLVCAGETRTLSEKQICLLSCNFPHDLTADED
ncbi:MAG: AraC family ligand binding domain-containing protein, partial [Parasporobacterium sp.]|nr:AraC family ligand binding domain-containing protein [Parasporobacterium sp.]